MKNIIILLILLFICQTAEAKTFVKNWPSQIPVAVCQANDTDPLCEGVNPLNGTPYWNNLLSPIGPQVLEMANFPTTWNDVSAFILQGLNNVSWSGFNNINLSGATITSDSNITTTAQMGMAAFNMPTGAVTNYVLTSDASGNGTWQQSTISGNQSCISLTTPGGAAASCCVDNSFNWSCSATGGANLFFLGNALLFNGNSLSFNGVSIPPITSNLFFLGNTLTFNGNSLSFNGAGSAPQSGMTFLGSSLTFTGKNLTFLGN